MFQRRHHAFVGGGTQPDLLTMLNFKNAPEGVRWEIYLDVENGSPHWESSRAFPTKEMAIQDVLMLHAQLQVLLATSLRSSNQVVHKKGKE